MNTYSRRSSSIRSAIVASAALTLLSAQASVTSPEAVNVIQTTYKVGMGQILVEGGKVAENLGRAAEMIQRAAEAGCKIVVLPECLDCGWTWPEARKLAQPVPGPTFDRLAAAARQHGIYVVAGLTERDGDKVYNAAVLISDKGELLLKHRKINELTIGFATYDIGDRLGVAHTPLGTIGINICADNFSNSLVFAHSLARMGAQIILAPSAWAVKPERDIIKNPVTGEWMTHFSKLTRLYDVTLVSVSNVGPITGGPWKGRHCIGNSLAAGPGGTLLAECPYGVDAEHLGVVEVSLLEPKAKGTAVAKMLKEKGYEGP